jgi:hypothetical protein
VSPQRVRAGVAGAMLAVFLVALGVFLLPFAFPTPAPIVTRFQATRLFSPDGDGRREVAKVNVRLAQTSAITVDVQRDGEQVARIVSAERHPRGWVRAEWDGRDADGRPVPDGDYALKLRVRSGQKQFNTTRAVKVDTEAPRAASVTVGSATLGEPGRGECRIAVTSRDPGQLTLEAEPLTGQPARRLGPRPIREGESLTWAWDGTAAGGAPVRPGLYRIRATLSDAARNRMEHVRTCWVGRIAGVATPPAPRPGERVGVRLRTTDGEPLPPETPVRLTLRRRTGVPGRTLRDPLGAVIGRGAEGRADRVSLRLPRGVAPGALWLVARTDGGAALVRLRP